MIDSNFDINYSYPLIGVDEVGKGSWAGPVMAGAALIDPDKPVHKKLNDSKKLSPEIRNEILVYFLHARDCTARHSTAQHNHDVTDLTSEIDRLGWLGERF